MSGSVIHPNPSMVADRVMKQKNVDIDTAGNRNAKKVCWNISNLFVVVS